jgi:hypothetical protein
VGIGAASCRRLASAEDADHVQALAEIGAEEWPAVARSVPAHWSNSLAVLAYRYATQWRAFAETLQRTKNPAPETAPAS